MTSGKIQTVLGLIDPASLGRTYTHEHLNLDYSCCYYPPEKPYKNNDKLPIELENLGWIRRHPYSNHTNLTLKDAREAIVQELGDFKRNGGGTIVECTNVGIHRDLPDLVRMAQATGINIIAGAGFYVDISHPRDMDTKSLEDLTATIVKEVAEGADETGIKCGVIGEIGCSWPLTKNERRVLQASALAQEDLGCPLIIHPGRNPQSPFEIVRILQENGADIEKTVMSHLDRTIHEPDQLVEFADMGSYCEYDLFGIETSHYQHDETVDMPSDAQRIQRIKHLIEHDFQDKIVMGHDVHTKHRLTKYGGHGYSHILLNIAPKMIKRGITQAQVDKILIENPREWLTFEK